MQPSPQILRGTAQKLIFITHDHFVNLSQATRRLDRLGVYALKPPQPKRSVPC
jgi:hypothetical protein